MPIVSDYSVVKGSSVHVGDSGGPFWTGKFSTRGRESAGNAVIMYEHSGIEEGDNSLWLNGSKLFNLEKSRPGGYRTDIGTFNASKLRSGTNTLEIRAAALSGGSATNRYDDFNMKNMVVFFHQDA